VPAPFDWSQRPLIAMVHVRALPGTPAHGGSLAAVREQALHDAQLLARSGVDGLMLENMHDTPYLRAAVGPEIVASLAVIAAEVRAAGGLPCGVQVLAAANEAALAVGSRPSSTSCGWRLRLRPCGRRGPDRGGRRTAVALPAD
jgi:predicted TIM-barrel enzyme